MAETIRTKVAVGAGLLARRASKLLGKGDGGMVGGRVALRISPNVLKDLSADKSIVLVTGTNGKSTTTKMTAEALGTVGEVATNRGGDNMTTGITTAVFVDRGAPFAVLEVDEMHLPEVAGETSPEAFVLLNLSSDQLDRVGEMAAVEETIRTTIEKNPQATIIANCDDPMIASAAWDAPNVIWVSVGAPENAETVVFPRTGTLVHREKDDWWVEGSDKYRRPTPDWTITDRDDTTFTLVGPNGESQVVNLKLPGDINHGNAAQAIVAAAALGANLEDAAEAVGQVEEVSGRYSTYDVDGRLASLLLAKNPAGWQQAVRTIPTGTTQLVIAVNAQIPDGEDLSWLWDMDFAYLNDLPLKKLVIAGERAEDLLVCLAYSDIEAQFARDPKEAILEMEPGNVQVLANYSAFRDLKKELESQPGKGDRK